MYGGAFRFGAWQVSVGDMAPENVYKWDMQSLQNEALKKMCSFRRFFVPNNDVPSQSYNKKKQMKVSNIGTTS